MTFAQVSVDPTTGAAIVSIPVYTFTSGQVALPVTLTYNGSGVKTNDAEGTAGMGWNLNTGGQVTRVVRGLPDDVTEDMRGNQRLGWMSSLDTAANLINSFTILNNGSSCPNEATDIAYINAHFPFKDDTEPDRFMVSAPGLSCEMVYDRDSSKFKALNYQDLVITYDINTSSHLILSFTITNDKGITYVFGNNNVVLPGETSVVATASPHTAQPSYFTTQFQQYLNGINYVESWNLVDIHDANGNGIQLDYAEVSPSTFGSDTLAVYSVASNASTNEYWMERMVVPPTLNDIQSYNAFGLSSQKLVFHFGGGSNTGASFVQGIFGMGHSFRFNYSAVRSIPTGFTRSFLRNFTDLGCSTPVNYNFSYIGETLLTDSGYYKTVLPDSTQNKFDYWGYYSTTPSGTVRTPKVFINPLNTSYPLYSIATGDSNYSYTLSYTTRTADPANAAAGSLSKIMTAQGGNTNIIYESNDFYNAPSSSIIKGGGVRVKQIIDSVGTHSTNNIIRNYSYLDPATGLSSGKAVSLPQYAFAIPGATGSGQTLYANATILSTHDLSDEDNTILYSYFKVSQTGAGSTVYQYYTPATFFDASAKPACSGCNTAEWFPTINFLGRSLCGSLSYTPMRNSTYAYPFIPNPDYDFERGLPLSVTSYNDSGSEVSESHYTYQRSFSPNTIMAFKRDDELSSGVTRAICYNKYKVYYNTSELTTKVVHKVYDSPTLTQAHADSVAYTYGSTKHKLMTQEQAANSDGSVVTTKINYVKDYTAASNTNPNVTAIHFLQQENINAPVETYQQITRAGVTKTVSAGLTLFKGVTPGSTTLYLPNRQYKLIQPDGLASFAPMTISGTTLTFDSTHYVRSANYDTYDKTGFPLTVDDNFKHITTTLINHFAGQPIAIFGNAAYGEVAFSDFDSDQTSPAYAFNITGTGSFSPVGSHAGNAAGLAASTQTASTGTMSKNAVAKNYVFSIWINAANAGTLTLTLTGISSHPTISITTGGWKYYELHIPVGTLSSSYTVSFTSNVDISIDDVLFYPDVSQVTTATYDSLSYRKIASTNTNGVSAYFLNDQWGRLLYTYDQDKNIVQKNTFITPADVNSFSNPVITGGTVNNTQPTTFTISGPDACSAAGTLVSWDFGDGTTATSYGLTSPSHTYIGAGQDTVRATIKSAFFGTRVLTPLIVTVNVATIPLTYTHFIFPHGEISSVTFTPVGTGTSYSFTGSTLNGGQILQGKYTILVTLSNGAQYPGDLNGYACVVLQNKEGPVSCQNNELVNHYTFVIDASNYTKLDFTVSQLDCSHFPIN